MSRRPPRFTQADLARALRAAEQAGESWAVEIDTDGTIRLVRIRAGGDDSRYLQSQPDRPPKVLF